MNNKVSIIVPIYNVRDYLDACITSVCNQTYKNIEIILVDDGSTDGCAEMCDRYAQQDDRIVVIHKKNGGVTSARKAGVVIASGEYIGFVDGDDWIDVNMYEEMLRAAVENNVDMVMTDMYRHKFTGEVTVWPGAFLAEGKHDLREEGELIANNLIPGTGEGRVGVNGGVHVKLFVADVLRKYLYQIPDDVKTAEDKMIVYSILLFEQSVYVLHKAYYHGVDRADSITHTFDSSFILQMYYVYTNLRQIFQKSRYRDILFLQLDCYLLQSVMMFTEKNNNGPLIPSFIISPEIKWVGKKVALYGAGVVGKNYYHMMKAQGQTPVAWVDKTVRNEYVCAPEYLSDKDYDILLIAIKEESLAGQIIDSLIQNGVSEEKIVWKKPVRLFDIS